MTTNMKPRDRVMAALSHKEPDRVPIHFGDFLAGIMAPGPHGYAGLCKLLGIEDCQEPQLEWLNNVVLNVDERVMQRLHSDFRALYIGRPENSPFPERLPDGTLRDAWGVILKPDKDGPFNMVVDELAPLRHATSVDDIRSYQFWPVVGRSVWEGKTEQAKAIRAQGYAVVAFLGYAGPIYHAYAWLRGFDTWLRDMKQNKTFYRALCDKILQVAMDYTERFLAEAGPYIDILFIGDDIGMQTQPIMSYADYRELIYPWQQQYFAELRRRVPGAKIMYHSCGSIYDFIPSLIDMGIDVINPIQPLAWKMEPERLKREFGEKVSFHGGIDVQSLLPFGTVEEVRQGVKRTLEIMAPGGGYVLAAAHDITPEVPPENVVAMCDAAYEFGGYG